MTRSATASVASNTTASANTTASGATGTFARGPTIERHTTRLWILSDLHLESVPHPDAFDPARPDFDILVCAGDVWQGRTDLAFETLRRLAGNKPVVAVLGNHEHWNGEVEENLIEARLHATANGVTLLEGEATTIEGTRPAGGLRGPASFDSVSFGPVRFVGATLWTDYALAGGDGGGGADPRAETGEAIMVRHEDDFGGGEHWLTVADAAALHERSRARLHELIEAYEVKAHEIEAHDDPSVPLVVVTHHAPHPDCLPLDHRGTWAAGNGASDLTELIDRGTVAVWVHGHLHGRTDLRRPATGGGMGEEPADGEARDGKENTRAATPTGTRIVQNAAGPRFHNAAFDEKLTVEV